MLNVTGSIDLGEVPVQHWFSRLYNYVFDDPNENGFRDADEAGIPEQAINLRWRDGSMYQSMPTDMTGFVPFEQVFPFFSWLVAEVDFTRFKATGVTAVVDAGGNPTNDAWPAQVGAELDPKVLVPQPQSENEGRAYRTETGPVLLEAFQGFLGQSSVLLWGKAPYAPPDSIVTDVNVAPFDEFPGACVDGQTAGVDCDWDANNNGAFDGDQFHGGVSGIVHYSTTRAENDPRWGGAEVWEPGIADVTVQLWDVTRTQLLNEVTTDSWDASLPTGCQGDKFVFKGESKDCYDGLRNFNQVRPGVFDGGYAFLSRIEPITPTPAAWLTPVAERDNANYREVPLPAGKYVVRVVPPRGYKVVKEEDKNVDFGDEYIPQEFYLPGYPLGDAGGSGAPPRAGAAYEPLAVPFCVGTLHEVPAELALYPGVGVAYAGDLRPTCDQKLVTLRNGQNPGANFFLFTEAPVAGHIVGFVLDDTANEFDPNSPQFGEKYAPPFMPISIRDWTGREITSTHTDAYGRYNVLVPSTFTANQPIPSGMSPSMLTACVNSPTVVDANGVTLPNPDHYKQYSHFCYTFQYMPGTTTYLDTPVLPTGAFTGVGQFPVDAEFPNETPVIASVSGTQLNLGPYIVDGNAAARTILIKSAASLTTDGLTQVPNPAYEGIDGAAPKLIKRDYGFGTNGVVRLGDQPVPVTSWANNQIIAVVPSGFRTGQLSVERAEMSCTVSTTPLSTLAAGVDGAGTSLAVAVGDGGKFALNSLIQVDTEAMSVTGGNRSTLAALMTNAATSLAGSTLRVPDGAGSIFTTPANVKVDNEVIRLVSKSSTNLTSALGGNAGNIFMSVTSGTGNTRFAFNDYVMVDSEAMRVIATSANTLTVLRGQLGTSRVAHANGSAVIANDRFAVNRAFNGTTQAAHASGAAVVGDVLQVARAQDGTTAAAHGAGAVVGSYDKTCVTTESRKSTLGITLTVATPAMHTARPPIVKTTGQTIQQAIDAAPAGALVIVPPGHYEEPVVMRKPVRLQGWGALSTVISTVAAPAEKLASWRTFVAGFLSSNTSYLLDDQVNILGAAPFGTEGLAAALGGEAAGVTVFGRPLAVVPPATPTLGGACLQNPAAPYQLLNEAYCLQIENTVQLPILGNILNLTSPVLRANARIDGFSIIGAMNAAGIMVNANARNLDIGNNRITNNVGDFGGGIRVGHAGSPLPLADENAQNPSITIHNNLVAQNAGLNAAGGGGIVIGTGTDNYRVTSNFVAGNFTGGQGAGVAHIGRSPGGVIDRNAIVFNEGFNQGVTRSGGGLFIGGTPPAVNALTPGSGSVRVSNNLIQGNQAASGDGGGVSLDGVNGGGPDAAGGGANRSRIAMYNNVVVNNSAGLAGGGVSLHDAAFVEMIHNTVARNDSFATAGGAFVIGGGNTSTPQPAGIVSRGHSPLLGNLGGAGFSNPTLVNSIVWQNRSFFFGQLPGGVQIPGDPNPAPVTYGLIANPTTAYWDLGVLGAVGSLNPLSSVLTSATGYDATNSSAPPSFVAFYANGSPNPAEVDGSPDPAIVSPEQTSILTPIAFDEGGTFIRPMFGPLTLQDPADQEFFGNYHVTVGEPGQDVPLNGGRAPLLFDIDGQARPSLGAPATQIVAPDRGADEKTATAAPTNPIP